MVATCTFNESDCVRLDELAAVFAAEAGRAQLCVFPSSARQAIVDQVTEIAATSGTTLSEALGYLTDDNVRAFAARTVLEHLRAGSAQTRRSAGVWFDATSTLRLMQLFAYGAAAAVTANRSIIAPVFDVLAAVAHRLGTGGFALTGTGAGELVVALEFLGGLGGRIGGVAASVAADVAAAADASQDGTCRRVNVGPVDSAPVW